MSQAMQLKIRRLFNELRDQVTPELQPLLYRLEQVTTASLVLAQRQESTEAREVKKHVQAMSEMVA